MAKVILVLANGFEEVEAVSLVDVMRRGGIDVRIVHLSHESKLVTGANGIHIEADTSIRNIDANEFDMIVLPGGFEGTYALVEDEMVQEILKDFKEKTKYIGAICAAPLALKSAGVLPQNYTCYPSVVDDIAQEGYRADMVVVRDGNIFTSRGPGTALCFGLEIVRTLVDEETYEAVRSGMLLDFCL